MHARRLNPSTVSRYTSHCIAIHGDDMANIYYYYQEKTIDKNDLPMAASIGRKQFLVGKWPMADRYIVLCIYVYMIRH